MCVGNIYFKYKTIHKYTRFSSYDHDRFGVGKIDELKCA